MGFNHKLGFWAFLFFLILFISFFSAPNLSFKPQADAPSNVPTHYQVLKVKNTMPFFLNEDLTKKQKKRKRRKSKNFRSRPFSVMLPKGFVPPSGSSRCHNDAHESSTFYCDFSIAEP
ncbi:hypothetical protein NE237_031910 [Protea cynaroides]|uniref:Uncharacterized protein n=1 Tax=Protea cynaroides TaxID=273540 RepID=A0A9Q0R2L4_9MAGN|nr:hypothetical protein NE237_031910 [Protea cynaroides]